MNINVSEAKLLTHVLETTGEKVKNDKGEEVFAPRTLNGEESSQRGHFTKNTKELFENFDKELKDAYDKHNAIVAEVKKEVEKDTPSIKKLVKEWEARQAAEKDEDKKKEDLNPLDVLVSKDKRVLDSFNKTVELRKKLLEKKTEVRVEDKTKAVLKKYFEAYGNSAGFLKGDDEVVGNLTELLK